MLRNSNVSLYKSQKSSNNTSLNKSLNQSTTSIRKFHSRSVSKQNRSFDHDNFKSNPQSANKGYSLLLSSIANDANNSSMVSDFTLTEKENSDPNTQATTIEYYKEKIEEIYEKSKVLILTSQ